MNLEWAKTRYQLNVTTNEALALISELARAVQISNLYDKSASIDLPLLAENGQSNGSMVIAIKKE